MHKLSTDTKNKIRTILSALLIVFNFGMYGVLHHPIFLYSNILVAIGEVTRFFVLKSIQKEKE